MSKKFNPELPKDQQIEQAKRFLVSQGVSVGVQQIKPPFLCGIGTWGVIDFLRNQHKFTVLPWWSTSDPA